MASKQALKQELAEEMAPEYQKQEDRMKRLKTMHDVAAQLVDRLNLPPTADIMMEEKYPYKDEPYWSVILRLNETAMIDIDEPGSVYYYDTSTHDELDIDATTTPIDTIVDQINALLARASTPS
jgi:hypothetical protein